jgi:hypothetical protein
MSGELPTEEDVLAAAILYAVRPVVTNCDDTAQMSEAVAWGSAVDKAEMGWAGYIARERVQRLLTWEAVIADSERRVDVERARDAVVAAARTWDWQGGLGNLNECLADLNRAELESGVRR